MATPRRATRLTWECGLQAAALLAVLSSTCFAQSWREAQFPSRASHCAVYTGSGMLVFGGKEGGTLRNDVWLLSETSFGPRWRAGSTSGTRPTPRAGHTGIYDPVRQRMIVFGGNDGAPSNQVWALSATWTLLTPLGTPPSPREDHTAIYDPVGDRMIVFGGNGGTLLNDVWALSLADPPTWTPLATSGTPPSPRRGASVAYDSQRQRMIVFGGATASTVTNDLYTLDLASGAWAPLAASGSAPQPRAYASALYDALADRLLIVGGEDGSPFGFTVIGSAQLLLSGTPTWQGTFLTNDTRGSLVYDSAHNRGLLYGGFVDQIGPVTNQTWAIDLSGFPSASRLVPTAATPTGLAYESAVFDPVRNQVVVFGGAYLGGFEPGFSNNTAALVLPVYQFPNPLPDPHYDWIAFGSGTPPAARYGHSAIRDPDHDRMMVFGGNTFYTTPAVQHDVWALPFATGVWSQLVPTGAIPQGRFQHTAIYDGPRHRMIVFGGSTTGPFDPPAPPLNDVWQLDLSVDPPAWSQLVPFGTPPPARFGHSAIHDLDNHRMIVFGGRDANLTSLNDVWSLSLDDPPTWTQITPTGTPPPPVYGHSAVYHGWTSSTRRMVVYGGSASREVWSLQLARRSGLDAAPGDRRSPRRLQGSRGRADDTRERTGCRGSPDHHVGPGWQ